MYNTYNPPIKSNLLIFLKIFHETTLAMNGGDFHFYEETGRIFSLLPGDILPFLIPLSVCLFLPHRKVYFCFPLPRRKIVEK